MKTALIPNSISAEWDQVVHPASSAHFSARYIISSLSRNALEGDLQKMRQFYLMNHSAAFGPWGT